MKHVYLSGPMTGIKDFNYPLFNAVAKSLRENYGAVVFNPAEFPWDKSGDFPAGRAFACFSQFICLQADTVILLPGWEASKGAQIEKQLAEYCGVKIVEFVDEGPAVDELILREVCNA